MINIINQIIHAIVRSIVFRAHKIPRNEANPLPPLKLLIHIGNIWPSKIIDEDKMIKSPFMILHIDIPIYALEKSTISVNPAAQ